MGQVPVSKTEPRHENHYKELEASLRVEWRTLNSNGLPCGSPFQGADILWRSSDHRDEAPERTPCEHIVPIYGRWGFLPSDCLDAWTRWESTLPKKIDECERRWNHARLGRVSKWQFLGELYAAKGSFKEVAKRLGLSRFGVLQYWVGKQGLEEEVKAVRIAIAVDELSNELAEFREQGVTLRYRIRVDGEHERTVAVLNALRKTEVTPEVFDWFHEEVSKVRKNDDTLSTRTFILEVETLRPEWQELGRHEGARTRGETF